MKISIREAGIADAGDISVLSAQLGYPIPVSATTENLDRISKNRNELVLVALLEGKLVGWIHVFQATRVESGSFCEIGGLVVDEQFRKMGIGRLLTERIKDWCIAQGTTVIRVRSNVKRNDAHQFYTRSGFREIKEQKVFEIDVSNGG